MRNKGDPFCDSVELVEGNPTFSVVHLRDGRESTVSASDLASYPPAHNGNADPANSDSLPEYDSVCGTDVEDVAADETDGVRCEKENDESSVPEDIASDSEPALPRRSTRRRKLIGMVSMSHQFERGRLWRFVCCCITAFMSLSRNVDCCHDRSGQLVFVFYASVERAALLLPSITRT